MVSENGTTHDRFIPAGAGNTRNFWFRANRKTVYPRWRGEHSCRICLSLKATGLSPLARGTQRQIPGCDSPRRFIPAGAGNTSRPAEPGIQYAVYPRWRGEHIRGRDTQQQFIGLSPLARGTHGSSTERPEPRRFIPAGAGNTDRVSGMDTRRAVYPRWRGEHQEPAHMSEGGCGLSPLARGTLVIGLKRPCRQRFIPAGAGNTGVRFRGGDPGAVYPRWRGEHISGLSIRRPCNGLSPLARGTHVFLAEVRASERFIPAGAGNTRRARAGAAQPPVYPRWRGEHSKAIHLYCKVFFAIKKTTNFSIFLKNTNLLIINGQKRD